MAFPYRYWLWLSFIVFLCPMTEAQENYTDPRTGVKILFPENTGIFPHQWTGKKVSPSIQPLTPEESVRLEDLLSFAFSKYPASVLNARLNKVYVVKSMTFYGLPYGGTNYQHTVFLSDDTDNPWFSDEYIEQVFHHEFSSILLRDFPDYFDKTKWLSLNTPSFRYGKGGADAIQQGLASMALDPETIKQGFLSQYSTASVEEDINVVAQNLFAGNREFWRVYETSEAIRKKTMLLISFYHRINPVFTESYFRSFTYGATAQR
jgi:hypothetical protein